MDFFSLYWTIIAVALSPFMIAAFLPTTTEQKTTNKPKQKTKAKTNFILEEINDNTCYYKCSSEVLPRAKKPTLTHTKVSFNDIPWC